MGMHCLETLCRTRAVLRFTSHLLRVDLRATGAVFGAVTWLYLGTGLRMPREHSAFLGISPFAVASHVLLLHSLGPCDSCVPAKAPVLPQAPLGTALRTCVASLLPSQHGKPSGRRASLPGARVLHQGTSCSGELLWVSGIVCTRD